MASPVPAPPHTTFSTPGGSTSPTNSAIRTVDAGVSSDGFRTTVFPAATAGAHFQTAIISG